MIPREWVSRIVYGLFWLIAIGSTVILIMTSALAAGSDSTTRERDLAALVFWAIITLLMWTGAFFALVHARLSEMRDLLAAHAASPAGRHRPAAESDYRSLN